MSSPFPAPQFQRKLVPGTYHAIRSDPEPRGVDDVHNLGVGGVYALFRRDRVKHEACKVFDLKQNFKSDNIKVQMHHLQGLMQ